MPRWPCRRHLEVLSKRRVSKTPREGVGTPRWGRCLMSQARENSRPHSMSHFPDVGEHGMRPNPGAGPGFEPRPYSFRIGFPWSYVLCRDACCCDKEVLVLAVLRQGDAGWMRTANGGSTFSPSGRLIAWLSVSGRGQASAPTQDSLLARPQCAGGTDSGLHTADTRYTSPLAQDSQALPSPGYAGRLSA